MKRRAFVLSFVILLSFGLSFARAEGYRTFVGEGEDAIPLVVVKGTPYEVGFAFGKLMEEESKRVITGFLTAAQLSEQLSFTKEKEGEKTATRLRRYSDATLDAAWAATSPHISERFKQQMRGVADGAGIPWDTLRRAYMIPVVSDYSCSGAALWGKATADGNLYQFRNLDYIMDAGLQNDPVLVVCLPEKGIPHISATFAGFLGVNTGMNAEGTVLTSIGDSPSRDYPFDLDGTPFFTLFDDLLHDASTLDEALDMLKAAKRIKKYHYIIANGKEKAGAKIKAHAPDLGIWQDNDPTDEEAPNVFEDIVYQAEKRNPLAVAHIKAHYGKYDVQNVIDLTKIVPIKGDNLLAVVYDATALQLWVSYAKGKVEAYQRPFIPVRLTDYLDYRPDGPNVTARVK